jgi:hypothetical protein
MLKIKYFSGIPLGGAAVPREVAFPIGGDLPNFRLRDGAFCHHSFLSWYNLLEAKRKGYLLNPKNFPELSEFLSSTCGSLILYFLIWWCFQNGVYLIRSHAYLGRVRELG